MLIICNEGKYKEYENAKRKNPQLKPSIYCKANLGLKDVKSYKFVKDYFANIDILIGAIHEYRRISKVHGNEKTLWDLLK